MVDVVSVAGAMAFGTSGPYSASKHAQLAFSRSCGALLAPRGIRVHTVLPGFVETEGFPQRGTLPSPLPHLVVDPPFVARRIVEAVERGRREVYVPRWYRPAAVAYALAPRLLGTLAARSRRVATAARRGPA